MNQNRDWQNQSNWQQNRYRGNDENNYQDNYDYGNYTSDNRINPNQNQGGDYGSYEGAPSGYLMHHPGNPNPDDGMHGYNDYGYAGGNPGFESAAGQYRGNDWPEANKGFGVGTGRTYDFYGPHNDRQTDMGGEFSGSNDHRRSNYNQNPRPKGQTMDSWDNDFNHWRSEKYGTGGFEDEKRNRNESYNYRPQNQGYFGENMGRHSGGNLYNERFRNDDSFAHFNREEGRWHADSLSDRNIEGWGR